MTFVDHVQMRFNAMLDRLVRPTVRLHRREWSAFHVCGCTGLELAVLLALALVLYRGLSPWVMGAIVGAAILSFYVVSYATKIITGTEALVYYHHEIAVLCSAALLVWLLGQPPLAYLDATILGVGTFLACGRIGCLMVGCCHGRPHRWGVVYRAEHAANGFPRHYVGVRIFPIQAIEALWVLAAVLIGCALILGGAAPGAALAWYVVAYDLGRFCFEWARGDTGRPYRYGFSEAQWISLLLTWAIVGAEYMGVLPLQSWHALVAIGLLLTMAISAAWRRKHALSDRIRHPAHLYEIASALATVPTIDHPPRLVQTSLGMCISTNATAAGGVQHYGLSYHHGKLDDETVALLANIIAQLCGHHGPRRLIRSTHDIVHLLLYP